MVTITGEVPAGDLLAAGTAKTCAVGIVCAAISTIAVSCNFCVLVKRMYYMQLDH